MAHMRTDINFCLRVLRGIELLPLEEITAHPAPWRRAIARVIRELDNRPRMRDDDPLLFDRDGVRLSEEQLQENLTFIIDGWPQTKRR